MDEMTLTLNNPLTEEEWDLIEDVDFDKTNSIEFHTKHGKTVKFVKCTDERAGDTISRRQAIDALGDEPEVWSGKDEYAQGLNNQWHYDRNAIKALPSARPEQQWNSGMFPEESGIYTVTAYDGATERVTYAKYQKRLKRWELTGARAYWRVLAWMPLPEPYKAERQEE